MVKTVREFRDELRAVREEMYEYGESADVELVASWLDRIVISLEKMSDTMELMGVELEMLSNTSSVPQARKAAKKKPKKAVKKKPKKAAKKKPKKAVKKKMAKKAVRKAAKKKIGKAIFKTKKAAKKKKPAKKKRRR